MAERIVGDFMRQHKSCCSLLTQRLARRSEDMPHCTVATPPLTGALNFGIVMPNSKDSAAASPALPCLLSRKVVNDKKAFAKWDLNAHEAVAEERKAIAELDRLVLDGSTKMATSATSPARSPSIMRPRTCDTLSPQADIDGTVTDYISVNGQSTSSDSGNFELPSVASAVEPSNSRNHAIVRAGHTLVDLDDDLDLLLRRFQTGEAGNAAQTNTNVVTDEEIAWASRQQTTGVVGKIVRYTHDDKLENDFVLRGGHYGHFVVDSVLEGGLAAEAGVKAGYRLASINNKKDFIGLRAAELQAQMRAPASIVFLGFVGELRAEVQLPGPPRACGLPLRHEVAHGCADNPFQIADETVFDAGTASLFLAIDANTGDQQGALGGEKAAMLELSQRDAERLLRCALNETPSGTSGGI